MKWLFVLLTTILLISPVTADAFSAWSAYGDAWKATNDTHTLVMWNATGSHSWLATGNATSVEYLVVAGGGAGGSNRGGGGGGGGFLEGTTAVVGTVDILVGAGGTAPTYQANNAGAGGNSSFGSINASGGARAPGYGGNAGYDGGSGSGSLNGYNGGNNVSGQGFGGGGSYGAGVNYGAGGGGGAGGVGANGTAAGGGNGGIGKISTITGESIYYAGGGGGGQFNFGTPGTGGTGGGGGGGYEGYRAGHAGTNGLGGGGGGAYDGSASCIGGAGGSGVVIIRYQTPIAPVASFTNSPNPSLNNTEVQFTDTSTNIPTTWNWSYDGGTTWENGTVQNPTHTFTEAGTYNITMICNNTVGVSDPAYLDQVVIEPYGWNRQDIEQEGQFTASFPITDSQTGAAIPVVTVTTSDGQTYTTSNGTAYFTYAPGVYVAYFAATGYVSKSVSFVVDGDVSTAVAMTPASTPTPIDLVDRPKDVKFHITSFFGAPIPGATVTILGITTSTGNWDWLVTLLGIPLDEVAINGTAMSETTDTNGDAVFLMVPSIKYNITVSASGYTFPNTIIAPQASQYPISANWNESWFSSGNDTLKDVNVSVSWVKYNDTYSFVNITYDDQTGTTTGGTITVYRDATTRIANDTAISTMDITGTSCSNSTLVDTPTGGSSYRVLVNATTTDENIVRTFTHYFKGSPVMLPGFTSETILWLALFVVIFTAAFAGATHSPQMSVVLCVESWVFWAIGWLDYLMSWFGYGEIAVIGILTLASFIVVLWNITEGKAKGKRSS